MPSSNAHGSMPERSGSVSRQISERKERKPLGLPSVNGELAKMAVATAIFANSPFTEGKPNGFLSFRSEIWRDTDPDRSGMLPWAFELGMGFERYVDYALDVPMYFVKRGEHYIDVAGQSRAA